MNLDDNQKQQVAQWLDAGAKLSEIQSRLDSEFGLKLTYMEVRFLVDDMKLTLKDPEPSKSADEPAQPMVGGHKPEPASPLAGMKPDAKRAKGVSVTVDTLTKPGTLVSGKVTFSDGNMADWYLDQTGRLGLAPKTEGYRPSAADVQEFQVALEREITRAGL
ncbi:MAG: hypothetical protein MUC91_08670 [Verrucomicrobia bacterium]|jgi:hypothetical protein|nr:hypothetical protein [Verrucomicrobiota bacterium]